MSAEIWVIVILTLIWLATVFVVSRKNKELDDVWAERNEYKDICKRLGKAFEQRGETIEQQVKTIEQLEADLKFCKEAYYASEKVRIKLAAERGGNE